METGGEQVFIPRLSVLKFNKQTVYYLVTEITKLILFFNKKR
jgi:hypothetical protein